MEEEKVINEEVTTPEVNEIPKKTEEAPQETPSKGIQESNFLALRKAKARIERERDEALRRIEELQKKPPVDEEEPDRLGRIETQIKEQQLRAGRYLMYRSVHLPFLHPAHGFYYRPYCLSLVINC